MTTDNSLLDSEKLFLALAPPELSILEVDAVEELFDSDTGTVVDHFVLGTDTQVQWLVGLLLFWSFLVS